ncbi:hypothetical protein ABW19_dt0204987 [Dactylella cylindrospora]|nr:hypothetical protein ABW19_dt0204987 [Dactylella cylindrospora]
MARVSPELPNLGRNHQIFISPPDPLLTQVIIFFLPYIGNSSRVDAHIYTACGFVSYSRMTVDPSSAVYQAVNYMPIEKTESEIYRALAFALCRYFVELTVGVKGTTSATAKVARTTKPEPFSAAHAGELAAKLVRVDDETAISSISAALKSRFVPSMDIDLVLPPPGTGTYNASRYQRLLQYLGDVQKTDTNLKRRPSRVERTRPKSVTTLPESNPAKVAIKLQELLDTEAKYVEKLGKLLKEVVEPERENAKSAEGIEPSEGILARLFPAALDEIYTLNHALLEDFSRAMDADDGVDGVADVFLQHFCKFNDCYSQYIALNPASSGLLGELMRAGSAFSQRITTFGEQYLKSILIEPIQRLPRYTMIIDGVLNNIAVSSPVASKFVLARDTISKICEMQSAPSTERQQALNRLSSLISGWPTNFRPAGTLVTAVDLSEVSAPYNDFTSERTNVIILVFTDSIAFISRPNEGSMKAQGVLTEITMPSSIAHSSRREAADLYFAGCTSLNYTRYSTSDNGRAMWITLTKDLEEVYDMRESAVGMKKFLPSGPWEGKANELVEEIIQAQLQCKSRVQETRWSGNANSKFDALELWTSVYDPQDYEVEKSPSRGLIRMGIDSPTFDVRTKAPEISATVNFVGTGKIRVDVMDMGKLASSDTVSELDILTVLTKRLSSVLEKHAQTSHGPIIAAMIQAHRRIIRSMELSIPEPEAGHSKLKSFRPPSPVKLLHTFLGSSSTSPGKSSLRGTAFESTTEGARPTVLLERSHSVLYRSDGGVAGSSGVVEELARGMKDISLIENNPQHGDSYHKQLERVLDAFIIVLEGKLVKDVQTQPGWVYTRRKEDGHTVDQLVKALLNDSSQTAVAQAAGLEVLLNAFEKFLVGKWREIMGTLLTTEGLRELQGKFDSFQGEEFSKYFRNWLDNLGPQNKRAFNKISALFLRSIERSKTEEAKNTIRGVYPEVLVASGLSSSKISEVAKVHSELLIYLLEYTDTSFAQLSGKYAQLHNYGHDHRGLHTAYKHSRRHETYANKEYVPGGDQSPPRRLYHTKHNVTSAKNKSPSPTRGRSRFAVIREEGDDSGARDKEKEVSPSRLGRLMQSLEKSKRLATYSPSKTKYTGDSSFLGVTGDAAALKRSKTTGTPGGGPYSSGIPVVPSSNSSLRRRLGLTEDSSLNGVGGSPKAGVKAMLRQRSNKSSKDRDRERSLSPTKLQAISLYRSQSTDVDSRKEEKDSRPSSRERPISTLNPLSYSKYQTQHKDSPLSPIADSPSTTGPPEGLVPGSRRKKRRSSLSDLISAREAQGDSGIKSRTDTAETPLGRTGSERNRKENTSPNTVGTMGPPPLPHHVKSGSVSSIPIGRDSRSSSTMSIPESDKPLPLFARSSPDPIARERSGSSSSNRSNRLGTRLGSEKQNVAKASSSLEDELAAIGNELSRTVPSRPRDRDTQSISSLSSGLSRGGISSGNPPTSDDNLRRRIKHLENKVNNTVTDLNTRYEKLRDDSHAALAKEIKRNSELQELYSDVKTENEELYNRFNEYLEEVAKGLRGVTDKERQGLMGMLREAREEVGKLKGVVSALKKENIELRHGKVAEL